MPASDLHILLHVAETVVALNNVNAWPDFITACHDAACAAATSGQPWQPAVMALVDQAQAMINGD